MTSTAALPMPELLLLLAVLNLPMYVFVWRTFFGNWADFVEVVADSLSPTWGDIVYYLLFGGPWIRTKLAAFLVLSASLPVSEAYFVSRRWPDFVRWLGALI